MWEIEAQNKNAQIEKMNEDEFICAKFIHVDRYNRLCADELLSEK